jgi:hypothetical protein
MALRDVPRDWPEGLTSELTPVPELPSHAGYPELARAFGTVVVRDRQIWPKIVHALEFLRGRAMADDSTASRAAAAAEAALAKVDELRAEIARAVPTLPPLPPMRPESPSGLDVLEATTDRFGQKLKEIARESDGPNVDADPERLRREMHKILEIELAKREAARNVERLAAIDAENRLRARNKASTVQGVVIGVVTASILGAASCAWSTARGHAAGALEERLRGPVPASTR